MRGTLLILILVAVVAAGLWMLRSPPDTPEIVQSGTAEPVDGDPDATTGSVTDDPQAADSGTGSPADATRTAASATDAGTTQADEAGAGRETDTARPADAGTTGNTPQVAAAEPADPSATPEAVSSPAPEGMVRSAPIDMPAGDAAGQTDLLAAVEDAIDRAGAAVRERLGAESGADPDAPGAVAQAGGAPDAGTAQTADSGATPSGSAEQTAHADAAASPDAAGSGEPDAAETEAEKYVKELTATTPETIPVDEAAHFATGEHVLSLIPEDTIESVSVDEIARDGTLQPDDPITVVREVEQVETAVAEQLIAGSGGDLDTELRVVVPYDGAAGDGEQGGAEGAGDGQDPAAPSAAAENGRTDGQQPGGQDVAAQGGATQSGTAGDAGTPDTVEVVTVREVLERIRSEPEKPISIVKTVRYFEVMTLRELLDTEQGADTFLNVVTQPYRIEAATLADLLQRQKVENPGSIFYLHTVQPTDEQGIWGIVHSGLIDNFARGVAVGRGEAVETYKVQIPRDADERLEDQSSSYLGKLIDRKTKESFVYNYRDDRMGRNPDRIHPGQEIVIINFEPEELVSIYRHFASG